MKVTIVDKEAQEVCQFMDIKNNLELIGQEIVLTEFFTVGAIPTQIDTDLTPLPLIDKVFIYDSYGEQIDEEIDKTNYTIFSYNVEDPFDDFAGDSEDVYSSYERENGLKFYIENEGVN